MRRRSAGTRFRITRVLLAALGVSGALSASMAVSPRPAFAQGTPGKVINGCHIVPNPTKDDHTECPGAHLSGANLSNADLSDSTLSNVQFAILCHTTMPTRGISNRNCDVFAPSTTTTTAPAAVVNGCAIVMHPTAAHHTDCPSADLSRTGIFRLNMSHANLTRANLFQSTLTNINLSSAKLSGAVLREATVTDVDLSGADLSGADLYRAKFCRTTMPDGTKNDRNC